MIKPRNKPRKNIIGRKFGRLTVHKLVRQSAWGDWRYRCRCDCGTYTEVGGANLRKGAVQSCGCLRFKPIKSGTKFGEWVIIRKNGKDSAGASRYLCRCSCGNIASVVGYSLTRNQSTKCTACGKGAHLFKHGQSGTPLYNRLKGMRRYARQLLAGGKPTPEQVEHQLRKQGYRCYYCGKSLRKGYHLDHKTPLSRGGSNTIQNIVGACPKCNLQKNVLTAQEFKEKRNG